MGRDDLYITVPSFFKCPISLDVMKSPVSLCTGVTYDRASIQRWLDSGNNTCPATMQVLPTKDFVPNHTLHRLIQIWSTHNNTTKPYQSLSFDQVAEHIHRLMIDNHDNIGRLVEVLCFASEKPENRRFLAANDAFVDFLIRVVGSKSGIRNPDLLEAGLKIIHVISPNLSMTSILKRHPEFFSSLGRILKTGRSESRLAVAGLIQGIAPDPESKKAVLEEKKLMVELLQIIKSYSSKDPTIQREVAGCVLSSIVFLASVRTNKLKLVRAGVVGIMRDVLMIRTISSDTMLIELALTLLEMLAGSAEGRAAIGEDPDCIPAVVQKLMKVSSSANEHGMALLWSLCYLFRDQRAKEAVMRSHGGVTKILLLMQSDCSPAVKRMCCDLLRIFRVNSKSCLASYDSKTTHIMPC